ncbi:MAG: ABC transporter permease [Clostridia bacterium]|nr:ABC transporter permease [Clostridia bacterium]
MKKTNRVGTRLFEALIFLFLYAPIFILIIFSFNENRSRTVYEGFTFDWYIKLFQNESILNALWVTLLVSAIAAVVSTVAGTFTAVGLYSMRRRTRDAILAVNNIPVINADIITGVSLSLLFVSIFAILNRVLGLEIELGFGTLLIAHITFNIPYVILSVLPKLRQLDKNLFEAAQDLGATWMQSFFKVILPEIRPGIVSGLIMAFTLSIDDFVISYFTAGSRVQTLSMEIYAMTKKRISPEINALSTLLFVTVLVLLIIINVRQARQEKAAEKKMRALTSDSGSTK